MPRIEIEPQGRLAAAIKTAAEKAGLSLSQLAEKADSSYEQMRKIIRGGTLPSMSLLRVLAQELHADKDEWATLCETDRFYKTYKRMPKEFGQSADLERLQSVFPLLTQGNQDAVVQMARTLLRQQKASGSR